MTDHEKSQIPDEGSQIPDEESRMTRETSQIPDEESRMTRETSQIPDEESRMTRETSQTARETSQILDETSQAEQADASGPPTVDDLTVVHQYPGPAEAHDAGRFADAPERPRTHVTADETTTPPGPGATAPGSAPLPSRPDEAGAVPQPRFGPSVPTVFAGMLLIALAAAIGVIRLHGTSTQAPTATVVVMVVGAVCVVSGALVLLVGRQRT